MPYHGLRKWSVREMKEIASDLSMRPKFSEGQIVNTKRDNGCLCNAEVISSWKSGNSYKYWVKTFGDYERVVRNEEELW